MKAKAKTRFEALKDTALNTDKGAESAPRARRTSVLAKRQADVGAVASGKLKTIRLLEHDPARIRAWHGHNRDYEALSEKRCKDLIDGFKRAGQQFPAIVRIVNDSDQFDYEFVCGARRHWTAGHLERDLMIEVRELDDRDAFLLQDIENRDREDVSDLERARDYHRALPQFFEGNVSRMAEQLQIDRGNFTRLLQMVDLPVVVVAAYADERELVVHHGAMYTKMLKDPDSRKRVMAAAKAFKDKPAEGKNVVAALKAAATGASNKAQAKPELFSEGSLSAKTKPSGQCEIKFALPQSSDAASRKALEADFARLLDALSIKD